jgi:hypothetical protein
MFHVFTIFLLREIRENETYKKTHRRLAIIHLDFCVFNSETKCYLKPTHMAGKLVVKAFGYMRPT